MLWVFFLCFSKNLSKPGPGHHRFWTPSRHIEISRLGQNFMSQSWNFCQPNPSYFIQLSTDACSGYSLFHWDPDLLKWLSLPSHWQNSDENSLHLYRYVASFLGLFLTLLFQLCSDQDQDQIDSDHTQDLTSTLRKLSSLDQNFQSQSWHFCQFKPSYYSHVQL